MAYDPCVVFSAEQLIAFGVDPQSREDYRSEGGASTLVGCRWESPGLDSSFYIESGKNLQNPAVFRANALYPFVADVDINGRKSTVFRSLETVSGCTVAVPVATGSAVLKYVYAGLDRVAGTVDTCPQAEALAKIAEPVLPAA